MSVERIAEGQALAEAPVALPDGGLLFSDAVGGGVYRWSPSSDEVTTEIPKRRGIGGMALHADGGLVVSGRDVSRVRDGETEVLYADATAAGFNDLTVDPEGGVVAGALRFHPFKGEPPVPGEFVRIADGATVLAGVDWANGCAFSPDGATFYGCDYHRGIVLAADCLEGDEYGPGRVLVEAPGGDADGLALDEGGGLWVALGARRTVGRFRPDGALDAEIEIPADFISSLCFGGSDGRDLFVTAAGGVYLTRSPVAGVDVPAAR